MTLRVREQHAVESALLEIGFVKRNDWFVHKNKDGSVIRLHMQYTGTFDLAIRALGSRVFISSVSKNMKRVFYKLSQKLMSIYCGPKEIPANKGW